MAIMTANCNLSKTGTASSYGSWSVTYYVSPNSYGSGASSQSATVSGRATTDITATITKITVDTDKNTATVSGTNVKNTTVSIPENKIITVSFESSGYGWATGSTSVNTVSDAYYLSQSSSGPWRKSPITITSRELIKCTTTFNFTINLNDYFTFATTFNFTDSLGTLLSGGGVRL